MLNGAEVITARASFSIGSRPTAKIANHQPAIL